MYEEQKKDVQYPLTGYNILLFLTSFHLYIVIGLAGVFFPPFFLWWG